MTHSLLFLIGPRGSGKSTIGRVLAERLKWPFVDADEYLETAAVQSIAEIFQTEGEAGFRDRECAVLEELCRKSDHVIATGGGIVLRPRNRDLLKQCGFVTWLRTTPEAAFARMQADPTTASRRPNLTAAGGLAELRAIIAAREPFYRECADFAIDTEALSPEAVADAILTACGNSICRPSSGASSSSSSA